MTAILAIERTNHFVMPLHFQNTALFAPALQKTKTTISMFRLQTSIGVPNAHALYKDHALELN